jgi:hypothetical protein
MDGRRQSRSNHFAYKVNKQNTILSLCIYDLKHEGKIFSKRDNFMAESENPTPPQFLVSKTT